MKSRRRIIQDMGMGAATLSVAAQCYSPDSAARSQRSSSILTLKNSIEVEMLYVDGHSIGVGSVQVNGTILRNSHFELN